jgi:hypothetical protein
MSEERSQIAVNRSQFVEKALGLGFSYCDPRSVNWSYK